MVDIETTVFNYVATKIREKNPDAYVAGDEIPSTAFRKSSVAISIIEQDNTADLQYATAERIDNLSELMYEVNVYSNLEVRKKFEAREYALLVADAFAELGFARTFFSQMPNLSDSTIARYTARYTGKIDKLGMIYIS